MKDRSKVDIMGNEGRPRSCMERIHSHWSVRGDPRLSRASPLLLTLIRGDGTFNPTKKVEVEHLLSTVACASPR